MCFENSFFIKSSAPMKKEFTGENAAPMFRKRFWVEKTGETKLYVCGLGYAYYYLNGQLVSKDLFTAPVSNYDKTLWYNVYDVTHMLRDGENIIAVWCGNGWYNEDFKSSWNFDQASWRDVPKFILAMYVDGELIVTSDNTWKCRSDSAIWFNNLRSGEYFDARKYEDDWTTRDYNDNDWELAVTDDTPPKGVFRECKCEPVREAAVLECKEVLKTGAQKYVFDFGQNISGYVRLSVADREGKRLTIRYAEQLKQDGSRELNDMTKHYPESEFQTDKYICDGRKRIWSPRFTYHGFRYIEIDGLENCDDIQVQAVFVHQAVEQRAEFLCSDEFLNQMFQAGVISTWSNMFYQMTDCPTREKLGWTNDAQSSTEQILTDFKAERVLEKWLQDIWDAMRDDGALPGIIPTAGWGYAWGNGPVSDGVLFEIPYRIYLHTGNARPLKMSLPYFEKYFRYLQEKTAEDGFVRFGLPDWAKPGFDPDRADTDIPVEFINALLICEFYRIAAIAAELEGVPGKKYLQQVEKQKHLVMTEYIMPDGTCRVKRQTAVALLLYYDAFEQMEPLKNQLKNLIEEKEFHHDCGMVGIRRLLWALNKCGLEEYAYRILTVSGYPGYREWFKQGATTLWEYWDWDLHSDSKNHHMYSDFMSWLIKTVLGIRQAEDSMGFACVQVEPFFFRELDYAKGSCDTVKGRVSVSWERKEGHILLEVDVPVGMQSFFGKKRLRSGYNRFLVQDTAKER